MSRTEGFDKIGILEIPPIREHLPQDDNNPDLLPIEAQKKMRFSQDTRQRKTLVVWMIWVVSIWLAIVLLIVITNSLLRLGISDEVLVVLLATTTINVLGLANIILKGLFNSHKQSFKDRFNKKY